MIDRKTKKEQPITKTTVINVVISHFEGMSPEQMSIIFGRSIKSIQNILDKTISTGVYNQIIERWRKRAPLLYERALKKRRIF